MAAYASERDTPGLRAAAYARRGEAEQASSPTPTRTRRIHEPSLKRDVESTLETSRLWGDRPDALQGGWWER